MDQLYEAGVVGKEEGIQPRQIIMTRNEFGDLVSNMPTFVESISLGKQSLDKSLCKNILNDTTNYIYDGESLKNLKNMLMHKINEKINAK